MKLIKKEEWFEFDLPIGEPEYDWNRYYGKNKYETNRIVNEEGEIVWFGISVNWKKKPGEGWTVLGVDENVKPTIFIKGENGMGDYAEYPEGRTIWVPCEMPIYEKMYLEYNNFFKGI